MALNGMNTLVGASGITITGGSAVVHKDDGADIPNGIHIVDTSVDTLSVRPHTTLKSRAPVNTNGTFSKGKREFTHVRPKVLSDDSVSYPLARVAFEITHETTDAELLELKLQTVQLIMDSDMDDFYKYGSVRD